MKILSSQSNNKKELNYILNKIDELKYQLSLYQSMISGYETTNDKYEYELSKSLKDRENMTLDINKLQSNKLKKFIFKNRIAKLESKIAADAKLYDVKLKESKDLTFQIEATQEKTRILIEQIYNLTIKSKQTSELDNNNNERLCSSVSCDKEL